MKHSIKRALAALALVALAACGGGSGSGGSTAPANTSPTPGTLTYDPPVRTVSLNVADFTAQLQGSAAGQSLLQLLGAPTCGIDVYYLQYSTVGGAGEQTNATGALMVPTGSASCTGPRPIVLYAHGTAAQKSFNLAALADTTNPANSEAALIAAAYAAKGFIVVASNYAGYDASTLPYHPFLNAAQQSEDMINTLTAARTALHGLPSSGDAGILFLAGYSQGGYVSMDTQRALEAAGETVRGATHMSGPYALAAFGDIIFSGTVDEGATVFAPLLVSSFQHAYGNIYSAPTDVYSPTYAATTPTLLPASVSVTTLFSEKLLPPTALFNAKPTVPALPGPPASGFGFGNPFLITDDYRATYLADAAAHPDGAVPAVTTGLAAAAPANTLRQAFKRNDLRAGVGGTGAWLPKGPVLLCGGGNDPVVFFANSKIISGYFQGVAAQLSTVPPVHVLNLDLTTTAVNTAPAQDSNPAFIALQEGFTQLYSGTGLTASLPNYHTDVAPFCTAASAGYFQTLLP